MLPLISIALEQLTQDLVARQGPITAELAQKTIIVVQAMSAAFCVSQAWPAAEDWGLVTRVAQLETWIGDRSSTLTDFVVRLRLLFNGKPAQRWFEAAASSEQLDCTNMSLAEGLCLVTTDVPGLFMFDSEQHSALDATYPFLADEITVDFSLTSEEIYLRLPSQLPLSLRRLELVPLMGEPSDVDAWLEKNGLWH